MKLIKNAAVLTAVSFLTACLGSNYFDNDKLGGGSAGSGGSEPAEPHLVYAGNIGGEQVEFGDITYLADAFASAGAAKAYNDVVEGAEGNEMFQSERYGTYTYDVPVTNSTYQVVLYFVESYHDTEGSRVFSVSVEGQELFSELDLVAEAGQFVAYQRTIDNIEVLDGTLSVSLETITDNATLSGVEIYSVDGKYIAPPPVIPKAPELPPVSAATPENMGSDCEVSGLVAVNDLISSANLPDPFTKLDGTRISSKSEWRCRRQEIMRLAEAYIYGFKPEKPESVTGTVSAEEITVNVVNGDKSTSFSVSVELPENGTAPYPVLFEYLGFAQEAAAKDEGVAIVRFNPYDVGAESASRTNKQGAFYDIYGADSKTGLLVAWAWGISRLIDVIEASDGTLLQAGATAVAGCSRFGKGAFTAGVFDQRVTLTVPLEPGSGGVPIWRGVTDENAQSPSSAFGETYWLGDAFDDFDSATGVLKLPIDTHEIVALVAPRGLLMLDNPHIAHLGPLSAHAAALGGAEVYKALGAEENIGYLSNVVDGSHCSARPEHEAVFRAAVQKFLLKTGNTPGEINAADKAKGDLSSWVDWTTPVLTDD